jgi:hypothetical protein
VAVAQEVDSLSHKHKALNSNPSTTKKTKTKVSLHNEKQHTLTTTNKKLQS